VSIRKPARSLERSMGARAHRREDESVYLGKTSTRRQF
jgi:hypothetical protein